MVPVCMVLEN